MRLAVRHKLVLLSLLILVVVSFVFTLLQLRFSRSLVEEDLRERAVSFAQEIAATIADRRELEGSGVLDRQVRQIMAVRPNVLHLDILSFDAGGARVVTSSDPARRLPFTRREAQRVRRGEVISHFVDDATERYWEIVAPVTFDSTVAGAVAAKFSLARADALAARTSEWALGLTAVSVLVMGLLMSVAVRFVVTRPVRRFLDAVGAVRGGDTLASVDVRTGDEFGELARHFNDMVARVHDASDELQTRVKEATQELEGRYREVERLNELLFAMQRSLSHAERLALSGRLMAEVAHEVGTPLHSVAGHLELLRQDLPAALVTDDVRRRLDVIHEQVERVTGIIAQLLDLSRRPPGPRSAVDLNALVADLAELVRPGIVQHGLTLRIDAEAGLPAVHGHGSQLQQVVLNLLTNAIDATPPGGRIRLATRARAASVELEVSDTGRGVAASQQRRIFEPFFSTKSDGHGSGLGLFISAQIVREHGGKIDVTSDEGRGATFRVSLPLAEGTT
jgi:two-component system, NtrC family, sensor histidine kinase HydH